ncbi:MAG: glycosyl hydrolase family 3 [Gammaproteobacteria bacterium]|nr:glycosyl hydrolase family 3 [Gammaproteobacteria bacterium]|tara:strand:+ start:7894 stop:10320 length:2427 start_codon:yes stop_codon:yes gene_type:complete
MKKVFIFTFLFVNFLSHAVDWTRENFCPTGDVDKVQKILSGMTVDEKVGQVIMADLDFIKPSDLKKYPLGGILNGGNTSPNGKLRSSPNEWKELAQDFYNNSVERGGANIPVLWGTDAVHGHSNVFGATIYPHNIGLGASQNPHLLKEIGSAVAEEVLATGLFWTFAPTVTVPQDYRWGRTYEGYSESPDLVTVLGNAFIEGLQGKDEEFLSDKKIIGTAKHFLGDGGTFLGRDQGDTKTTEEALKEIHGTSYFGALDNCIQTVMASFNSWNGSKIHGNYYILTEVLKNQMNFDGFVVGDWNGHGQVPGCSNANCAESFNAGVDMFMVPENWKDLYRNTLRQVKSGEITLERLDDAVRRILLVKERLGMFDGRRPDSTMFSKVGTQKNRDVARQAVRESMVLLKNNNNILPLSRDANILVVGKDADSLRTQTGGWTLDWQGTNNENSDFPGSITFLQAVQEIVGKENLTYVKNLDNINESYDAAIVVYGEQPYAEGVGDRRNLRFAQTRQQVFLKKLKTKGIPAVSIFFSGRPLWMTKELNLSEAFIAAWLPGTESRGMTDVIFKKGNNNINYDFIGKLPFSWPKNPFQANLNFYDSASDPLFPFDYGLNYESSTNLSFFNEELDQSFLELSELSLLNGAISEGFLGYIQENNLQQIQILSGQTISQSGVVSTELIDVEKQDDTLKVVLENSQFPNSLIIISQSILNLNNLEGGFLNIKARFLDKEKPMYFIFMCGFDCMATLDLSNYFSESNEFSDYSIPLSCLVDQGVDLSKVNIPFILMSEGPLDVELRSINFAKNKTGKLFRCN